MEREIELSRFIHGRAKEQVMGIRMHRSELLMLDEAADKLGISRSEFVRAALRAVVHLKILEIDDEEA